MPKDNQKQILMTRRVATRWLRAVACPEYRFKAFYDQRDRRNITGLLYSLRDGKVAMEGVPDVRSLGLKKSYDGMEMWSKDKRSLLALQQWFEVRGYETTGLW